MNEQIENVPLCVDLDGTLIKTDMLMESLVRVIKKEPWVVFLIPIWLLRGKQILKHELALRAEIDIKRLPFHEPFLEYLRKQHESGRELILVTGSNIKFADQVADHLGIFSRVFASDLQHNLTGSVKALMLAKKFGSRQFDYAGNEKKDIHIWREARHAVLVNTSKATARLANQKCTVDSAFTQAGSGYKRYLKAIRIHQWTKNALIFVPMFTAHLGLDFKALLASACAFIAFGLCASATYIVNDLFDLDADRAHKTKHKRPFAAGDISIVQGVAMSAGMLTASFLLALFLPWGFFLTLLGYLSTTLAYSFYLKTRPMVDVLLLAGLYTVRVIAGAQATQVELSFWLLAFSIFLFLSLALVKRVSELINLKEANKQSVKGRGYRVSDLEIAKSMGTSSGYMAVLVLALYINSGEVLALYKLPQMLWILCPVMLYWISRTWLITARGEMNEDPIVFAIKDGQSWVIGGMALSILMLATW